MRFSERTDAAVAVAQRTLGSDLDVTRYQIGRGFRFRDRDPGAAAALVDSALTTDGFSADVDVLRGQVWVSIYA